MQQWGDVQRISAVLVWPGGDHPQEDWEMGLVSAMVLVLSVLKVLVATVEGSSLISVPSKRSLVILCSRGCWVSLCWWLLLMDRRAEAFCPPGSLWAVLHEWQKQQSSLQEEQIPFHNGIWDRFWWKAVWCWLVYCPQAALWHWFCSEPIQDLQKWSVWCSESCSSLCTRI